MNKQDFESMHNQMNPSEACLTGLKQQLAAAAPGRPRKQRSIASWNMAAVTACICVIAIVGGIFASGVFSDISPFSPNKTVEAGDHTQDNDPPPAFINLPPNLTFTGSGIQGVRIHDLVNGEPWSFLWGNLDNENKGAVMKALAGIDPDSPIDPFEIYSRSYMPTSYYEILFSHGVITIYPVQEYVRVEMYSEISAALAPLYYFSIDRHAILLFTAYMAHMEARGIIGVTCIAESVTAQITPWLDTVFSPDYYKLTVHQDSIELEIFYSEEMPLVTVEEWRRILANASGFEIENIFITISGFESGAESEPTVFPYTEFNSVTLYTFVNGIEAHPHYDIDDDIIIRLLAGIDLDKRIDSIDHIAIPKFPEIEVEFTNTATNLKGTLAVYHYRENDGADLFGIVAFKFEAQPDDNWEFYPLDYQYIADFYQNLINSGKTIYYNW
jgi:hypothetical protein